MFNNRDFAAVLTGVALIGLVACGASAKLGGVAVLDGANNVSTNNFGRAQQLSYMVNGTAEEVCAAQGKLAEAASYKVSEEAGRNGMSVKIVYTDDKSDLTVMCSEQKDGERLVGIKVTLTLMGA